MGINDLDNMDDSDFYSDSTEDFSFEDGDEKEFNEVFTASGYANEMGMVCESADSYY